MKYDCYIIIEGDKLTRKLNHLKNEKELDTIKQTIRICSWNNGMKSGIEERIILIMKTKKRDITEGTGWQNQLSIGTFREKENHRYLRIFEVDIIKQTAMKENSRKEWLGRRTRKLPKTKLCGINLIKSSLYYTLDPSKNGRIRNSSK